MRKDIPGFAPAHLWVSLVPGTFYHHMWLLSLASTQITAGRGAHPHMQLAVVSITCSCSQVIAFTISSSARLSDRHHVKTVQRQSCWLPHKVFSQRSLLAHLAIGSLHVGVFCFAALGNAVFWKPGWGFADTSVALPARKAVCSQCFLQVR